MGWAILALLSFGLRGAFADILHLKNGRELEGLIESESAAELVLNFGVGSITVPKADIARIIRSPAKKRAAGPVGSPELDKLFDAYQSARQMHREALDARSEKESLIERQARLEEEIEELQARYKSIGAQLRGTSPQENVSRYNSLVRELNSASAELGAKTIDWKKASEEEEKAHDGAHRYWRAFIKLKKSFEASERKLAAKRLTPAQRERFQELKEGLREMEGDFTKESIASTRRGSHIVVKAVINEEVTATLLVDTGATITTISPRIAEDMRLGGAIRGVNMRVADGRTVQADVFRLGSISVGKMKVNQTVAAVMPAPSPGIDGLLGMSYLKNFIVEVDARRNTLYLKSLK